MAEELRAGTRMECSRTFNEKGVSAGVIYSS
jgi:hypothetical protein